MTNPPWHHQPMCGYDLESTGVDPEQDRIVTGTVVGIIPAKREVVPRQWLADPGVEIPAGATAVHGITTEHARANGRPPAEVLDEIAEELSLAILNGMPIVGMNLPYDFTMLDRECRRHGVKPLSTRTPIVPVVDIYVLDKQLVPRRRGKGARRLGALCAAWGVKHDGEHDALQDALAAARVAYAMAQKNPELAALPVAELHARQIEWKRQQDADFADWLRSQGKPVDGCDGHWPIRPFRDGVAQIEAEYQAEKTGQLAREEEVPLW